MKTNFLFTAILIALFMFSGCSDEMETINNPPGYPPPPLETILYDIQGSDTDNIWIVGQPGIILHFNGTEWNLEERGEEIYTAYFMNQSGVDYICGHDGIILENSNSTWSTMETGTENNLFDIGIGPYESFLACGDDGTILELIGNQWSDTPNSVFWPSQNDTLFRDDSDIETLATVNLHAIGGAIPVDEDLPNNPIATVIMEAHPDSTHQYWVKGPIEADSVDEMIVAGWSDSETIINNWLIGDQGHLFRLLLDNDNYSWKETSSPGGDINNLASLTNIWVDENNSCWFTSKSGNVYKRTPADIIIPDDYYASSEDQVFDVTNTWLTSIWGTSSTDIWVVGYGGVVFHFDGTDWSEVEVPLPQNN